MSTVQPVSLPAPRAYTPPILPPANDAPRPDAPSDPQAFTVPDAAAPAPAKATPAAPRPAPQRTHASRSDAAGPNASASSRLTTGRSNIDAGRTDAGRTDAGRTGADPASATIGSLALPGTGAAAGAPATDAVAGKTEDAAADGRSEDPKGREATVRTELALPPGPVAIPAVQPVAPSAPVPTGADQTATAINATVATSAGSRAPGPALPSPAPNSPADDVLVMAAADGVPEAAVAAAAKAGAKPAASSAKPSFDAKATAKTNVEASDRKKAPDVPSASLSGAPTAAPPDTAGRVGSHRGAGELSGEIAPVRSGDGQATAAAADPAAPIVPTLQPADAASAPSDPFAQFLSGATPGGHGAGSTAAAGPAAAGPPAAAPTAVATGVALNNVPVEIGMRSLSGSSRFQIRLDPEELGRIDVQLDIDKSGSVRAHLVVDRPDTLAFLQRDSAQLQRAFEQAGLTPQDGGVALSLRNGASEDGGGNTGRGDGTSAPKTASARQEADPVDADAGLAARRYLWSRPSGVDLRI